MTAAPVDYLDGRVGAMIEGLTRLHHRRRLARLGLSASLDPPRDGLWCAGDPPPRAGNAIEVLIDGARALPAIAAELAAARSHVHVAGWHVQGDFALKRAADRVTVRDLLADLAERLPVRVLVWAGAPVPLFDPSRADVRRARRELVDGTRIECVTDSHERFMHCHHEKLLVIDDRVAFVGGMDMTALAGDRFDTSAHDYRAKLGWHDALSRLRGPIVADVAEHFRSRWLEVAGQELDPVVAGPAAGEVTLQLVRTLPERIYRFAPRGEFRILEAYTRALRDAQRLIYLENQFLWAPELVEILAQKLRDPPHPDFRLVILLPARANNGADDTRGQLGVLAQADGGAGRLLACALYAQDKVSERSVAVYVHAKIAIVDDAWVTIGSANLNAHSLYNDGEVNVVSQDAALARRLRLQLWAEHLELEVGDVDGDPAMVIDTLWRPIAERQRARRQAGVNQDHRLVALPSASRRSMRLLGPLQGLLVDG